MKKELTIEEAANKIYPHEDSLEEDSFNDAIVTGLQEAFIAGAKSDAAKKFHTKDMFTIHDVNNMLSYIISNESITGQEIKDKVEETIKWFKEYEKSI